MLNKYKDFFYLLPILFMGIFYLIKSFHYLPHDFANYYFGAYFLESGNFPIEIYDPTWFNLKIQEIQQNVFASYAPNTPFLALFFSPFTLLNFLIAKILFSTLSFALFLYALKRLFGFYNIPNIYLVWVPVILFIPIKNNILFGQVYSLLLFLLSEGFLAYNKEKYFKMSILWSLAILLKIFPIILFGFLIFNKKIKAGLYLGISLLILLTFSVILNGPDAWIYFLEQILPKSNRGEISGEFVKNYQSILMFLKHCFIFNEIKNANPLINSPFIHYCFLWLTKLVIFGYGILLSLKNASSLKTFSYWILATYLLSPYSSSYGSILLIFILTFALYKKSEYWMIILVSILLIANLPLSYFEQLPLPFSFFKLFLFVLITFLLFLKSLSGTKYHLSILCFSLISAIIISKISYDDSFLTQSNYLLKGQHQALIYDYEIKNNALHYKYWTTDGSKTKKLNFKASSISTEDLSIKNKQIFYKEKQITNINSNKLKPTIINRNELIYLSDYGRGFGFYTFRKVTLNNE